jgi:hypothetical protein
MTSDNQTAQHCVFATAIFGRQSEATQANSNGRWAPVSLPGHFFNVPILGRAKEAYHFLCLCQRSQEVEDGFLQLSVVDVICVFLKRAKVGVELSLEEGQVEPGHQPVTKTNELQQTG